MFIYTDQNPILEKDDNFHMFICSNNWCGVLSANIPFIPRVGIVIHPPLAPFLQYSSALLMGKMQR